MNKAQIDYIRLILNDAYIVGVMDGEIKSHDFHQWAEGYAEELDRMATPKAKVKRHTCCKCKWRCCK